jgi:DNA-nicking Smr family endonuclease
MTPRKTPRPGTEPRDDADEAHDEGVLFRRLMTDAKRLETDRVPPHHRRTRPRATFAARDRHEGLRDSLEGEPVHSDAEAGDQLPFRHASVSRGTFRRLARGAFSRQAELDLHGLTSAEAREALGHFIAECVERGFTCVRVIHGKGRSSGPGGPVLKPLTDQWLRRCRPVLAFVPARPVDGGSGALYVLLRRER